MPRLLFLLHAICFMTMGLYSHAAVLSGRLTSSTGEALPFANVYVVGTSVGTTTNELGYYQLELKAGDYKVAFQFIGYKKQVKDVSISDTPITLNVVLEAEQMQLHEVVVSGAEDPAYPIMRKAIAKRDYYYNLVHNFKCMAYVKGLQRIVSAPDKVFGQVVNFDGTLDSNNAGIIYLSETVSELLVEKPDKIKETVISSKVSGDSKAFSWNRSADFATFDFYTETQRIDFLSERVFISPLADNAFMYYKFKLEGFFEQDGKLINKIKVTPKRKSDPVYEGYIYIVEDDWSIHSLDLFLTKETQINYLDTLNFKYTYFPYQDSIWIPLSQNFSFKFNLFNIKAEGYFVSIYRGYDVNIDIPPKTFSNEILSITQESNERDSTYWDSIRPVPLTPDEVKDYDRKDSLEVLKGSKSYLDSMTRASNRIDPLDIVTGYTYRNYYKKISIEMTELLNIVQYNTVEGWNLKLGFDMYKEFEKRRLLKFSPIVRYGFSNTHLNMKADVQYFYNRVKYGYIEVSGGQYVYQYNKAEPITELQNSFYSLFIERNYMKIFEERFIEVTHRIEVANGLIFWAGVHYGRRFPLQNTTRGKITDVKNRHFTSNTPDNAEFQNSVPGEHDAAIFTIQLRYRPGQKYISRPDMKILMDSKFPTFTVIYRKAIPGIIKSTLNFDLLMGSIRYDIPMKIFGTSQFLLKGGGFLNNNVVAFQDRVHFYYNQTVFDLHNFDGFQMLPYYTSATDNWFAEGHYEHHFDGFFFNKIPGIRKLKWQLVAGAHFLYTPEFKDHTEIAVGVENIFRIFRVDFVTAFDGLGTRFGGRVGLTFNNF